MKSSDVGSAQSVFALAFQDVQFTAILIVLRHHRINLNGRAIRGIIVNHKEVNILLQCHHRMDHSLDIFDFVVGGDDN